MKNWKQTLNRIGIVVLALRFGAVGFAESLDSGSPDISSPQTRAAAEQKALQNCLTKWRETPFLNTSEFRKLKPTVSVLGVGTVLQDDESTLAAELILVSAVNVLGDARYQLLNPHGWYCVHNNVNVLAKTQIELACGAKLADGRAGVNVASNAPRGTPGVLVGSDVEVLQLPCDSTHP